MHEELLDDSLVQKVGGRFRLCALMQKRLVALNRGARPLVDMQTKNQISIVIQEIIQDKIYLDTTGTLVTRPTGEQAPDVANSDGGPTVDDMK